MIINKAALAVYMGEKCRYTTWPTTWDTTDEKQLANAVDFMNNFLDDYHLWSLERCCFSCWFEREKVVYDVNGKCDHCGGQTFESRISLILQGDV